MTRGEASSTLTDAQAALCFVLIGALVGAAGAYFGPAAWIAGVGLLLIASRVEPPLASLAGAGIGLAVGTATLLWIGASCPAASTCEPDFDMRPYLASIGIALTLGVASLVALVWRRFASS